MRESRGLGAARIYYAHGPLFGALAAPGEGDACALSPAWQQELQRCAGLGFSHLLISPPFRTGSAGDPFAPADHGRLHEALASESPALPMLRALADGCREHGLALLIDLPLACVDRDSELAQRHPEWLDAPALGPLVDPRLPGEVHRALALRWHDPACEPALVDWAGQWITELVRAGVSGFRCTALQALPAPAWRELLSRTRDEASDALFLASTPGLPAGQVDALADAGFDASLCSLPWWNFRDGWFTQELERLRALGDVVTMPESPFGPRVPLAGLKADAADGPVRSQAHLRALWSCAAMGDDWLMPMGFEFGADVALDPRHGSPRDWQWWRDGAGDDPQGLRIDLTEDVRRANEWIRDHAPRYHAAEVSPLTGPDADITVLARMPQDSSTPPLIIAINPSTDVPVRLDTSQVLTELPMAVTVADAGDVVEAAEVRLLQVQPLDPIRLAPPLGKVADRRTLVAAVSSPRIAIEDVAPQNDGGRFPVRRVVGERLWVEADVWMDGHDQLAVALLWRAADTESWEEVRMHPLGNDRWGAEFPLDRMGRYEFTVEAWLDRLASWQHELDKKLAAGQDVTLELEEGRQLRRDPRTAQARAFAVRHEPALTVEAERRAARFASWYELFPRSLGPDEHTHGRLLDVIPHLPKIRRMGFDVLYFPPIHPIGTSHRKGRNNALRAQPDDPGSPYAIGSPDGGHDAIHPQLGTLADLRLLVAAAADHGIELALDFAIQCSPDHPWLKEHPEWFMFRPDGTVRYAENPPKKYEDIVNVDFYAGLTDGRPVKANAPASTLWYALRDVVLFWIDQGIRIFRVDNPHTKPLPFWEWLIGDVRRRHPDAIFLAEAFTRPKMMARLAKVGFSQSYTYFTWRNDKAELTQYLTELTRSPLRDFFRPHFFVNTPDINPYFLQRSGRSGFLIRAALAATLSGLWGVYSGFETCEATPHVVNGQPREEYADSEKYQLRRWWPERPGHIVAEITRLNEIRKGNPALHSHLGLLFCTAHNPSILFYARFTPATGTSDDGMPLGGYGTDQRISRFGDNVLLVMVNLDPHAPQGADVELPLWQWNLPDDGALEVEDLVDEYRFTWHGKHQHVHIDPARPYRIWRVRPGQRSL